MSLSDEDMLVDYMYLRNILNNIAQQQAHTIIFKYRQPCMLLMKFCIKLV